MVLFTVKPWDFRGRRTERNAPIGRKCDETCTHVKPSLNTGISLCSVCHEVFSTVRNFDRHRTAGWCQEPSSVGLQLSENGTWKLPIPPENLEALRGLGI